MVTRPFFVAGRTHGQPGESGDARAGIPNFNRNELIDDPTVLYGDKQQQDTSGLRYGEEMSKSALKEYGQKE
ncbi:hypothetical protein [Neobacillus sp. Marseille-QA0830]